MCVSPPTLSDGPVTGDVDALPPAACGTWQDSHPAFAVLQCSRCRLLMPPLWQGEKRPGSSKCNSWQSLVFFSLLLCLSPPFCVYLQYSSQSFGPPRHVHRCGLGQPLTLYCESCVGRMRFASSQSPATAQQSPHIL